MSCHTNHEIASPKTDAVNRDRAAVRNCHSENLKSYADTSYSQVNALGFTYTAKCFDCHTCRWHPAGERSKFDGASVRRLQTCQKCHANATTGFVTFQPLCFQYARLRALPVMWIVSKFMLDADHRRVRIFWTHSALWFYRECRQEARYCPAALQQANYRSGAQTSITGDSACYGGLRICFALSLMVLSLTGMAVFYAKTAWAGSLMKALGGPQVAAVIHRTAAVIILSIFMAQLLFRKSASRRVGKHSNGSATPRW